MHSATLLALLPLVAAVPQYSSSYGSYGSSSGSSPSPSYGGSTSTPGPATVRVDVGKNGLRFNPEKVVAAIGTKIEFHYFPKKHSVTQSSFDKPCVPIDNAINSGFVPVADGESPTTFTVTVKDNKPLWFYCAQTNGNHCQSGMSMVVNEGAKTLEQYKQAAAGVPVSQIPGSVSGGLLTNGTSSNPGSGYGTGTSAPPSSQTGTGGSSTSTGTSSGSGSNGSSGSGSSGSGSSGSGSSGSGSGSSGSDSGSSGSNGSSDANPSGTSSGAGASSTSNPPISTGAASNFRADWTVLGGAILVGGLLI